MKNEIKVDFFLLFRGPIYLNSILAQMLTCINVARAEYF